MMVLHRPLFGLAAACVAAGCVLWTGGTAQARVERPWCAMIPMYQAGPAQLCHFDTLEQCRVEVHGLGGWCSLNPYYREPDARRYRDPPHRLRSGTPR